MRQGAFPAASAPEITSLQAMEPQLHSVINISGLTLDDAELSVLDKGLSYCPTNYPDSFKIKVDCYKFLRLLHLKNHFANPIAPNTGAVPTVNVFINDVDTSVNREETPFKRKSHFVPFSNLNPAIVTFGQLIDNDISRMLDKRVHVKTNLSDIERKAIQSLEKRRNLVLRGSDKGGSLVAMSYEQYDRGIKALLNDTECYVRLDSNPMDSKADIDAYIVSAFDKGWITEQEKSFLIKKWVYLRSIRV